MTTDNFCFYLQNRLVQTSQTGGQWYSDTSTFSIPWLSTLANSASPLPTKKNVLNRRNQDGDGFVEIVSAGYTAGKVSVIQTFSSAKCHKTFYGRNLRV
jgi:hypothetical protein